MQLAYQPVGVGVTTHSKIHENPIGRLRNTFTYVSVALLGESEEKIAFRRLVNRAHAPVKSEDGAAIKYNAFDPELQLWVAACLVKSFMDSLSAFRKKPNRQDAQALYELLKPLGTTLQVREGMWPADIDAFDEYWNESLNRLNMLPSVRDELKLLVDLKIFNPVVSMLFGSFSRTITTGFLPPKIQAQMCLPWEKSDQRKFKLYILIIKNINKILPRRIRQFILTSLMERFRKMSR